LRILFAHARALAAGPIVVLIGWLFNRHGRDVGVCPLIQFQSIKGNSLFADGKFTNVGSYRFVEFGAAHSQVSGRCFCPDESR
jgi:hypothetical protein